MHYLTEPRDWTFVKGHGFLSFVRNKSKNTDKNLTKNLSGKCNQKLLNHAKYLLQTVTNALKIA